MRFTLWADLNRQEGLAPPDWRLLETMGVFAQGGSLKDRSGIPRQIHSASTANNLVLLNQLFWALKPQRTLEIGLAFAASATLLLSLHRQLGHTGICHHAVDPLQETLWGNCGLGHIREAGLDPLFFHHARYSSQALPALVDQGEGFGLIYIDGSHQFDDVFVDFYYAHRLLDMGGILVFDDFSTAHVAKVVRFIRRNLATAYEELSPYALTSPKNARLKGFAASALKRQQTAVFRKVASPVRAWDQPLVDF